MNSVLCRSSERRLFAGSSRVRARILRFMARRSRLSLRSGSLHAVCMPFLFFGPDFENCVLLTDQIHLHQRRHPLLLPSANFSDRQVDTWVAFCTKELEIPVNVRLASRLLVQIRKSSEHRRNRNKRNISQDNSNNSIKFEVECCMKSEELCHTRL